MSYDNLEALAKVKTPRQLADHFGKKVEVIRQALHKRSISAKREAKPSTEAYERLEDLVRDGHDNRQIAALLGCTHEALRAALRRRGIRPNPIRIATVRETVERMSDADAKYYLLDQIEMLAMANECHAHPVDDLGISLSPIRRRILVAMYDACGPVSHEQVYNAAYFDRAAADDLPEMETLKVIVFRLRQIIPKSKAYIQTHHGFGYELHLV